MSDTLVPTQAELADEVDRLMHVIDRDRYIVAAVVGAIRRAINGRAWLLGEGRGPYEWDDERYKDEFRGAVEEIEAAAEPLAHVGWDKTDCTGIEERVEAARLAARDFLNRPAPKREMIAADIGLPCLSCTALRTTPNLATAVEDERVEQVAREFVIRVHDHLGKGRTGQVSLWSHVYPQFKDELREIANDIANTIVRTRPPTLPDDRDAVIARMREALTEARNDLHYLYETSGDDHVVKKALAAHLRAAKALDDLAPALSKHDRNEGGDDGQG